MLKSSADVPRARAAMSRNLQFRVAGKSGEGAVHRELRLAAGLRLRFETAWPAGGRHRAAPARPRLLGGRRGRHIADNALALDHPADLVRGQGLVFEETLRQRV